MTATDPQSWLAIIFIALLGLSMLIYVVLDGYDLGVGILLFKATPEQRDQMIASIGPFWDANETWLVLAVGILLVAFPKAHGMILGALYLPVALMLVGLTLRGVAFEFRAKAAAKQKRQWDNAFIVGSLLTTLTQGYMLGLYIVGLDHRLDTVLFAILSAVCVAAAYGLMGASWLIMKTEGALQIKAIGWAKRALTFVTIGLVAVSIVNPWVSERIFNKWFSLPNFLVLAPIPLLTLMVIFAVHKLLQHLPRPNDQWSSLPFLGSILILVLAFQGLAYSFYPYIVPGSLDIWQAASAPASLKIILIGVALVLPAIIGYTVFAYRVFRGKASALSYD